MMTKKTRAAIAVALLGASTALSAAVCASDPATPFTAGPVDPVSQFPQWVVDSNGVGLQVCTDSVDGQGNPPPCFYDPVEVGNPLSEALGRGGEAFYFLADNVFTTTGAAAVDAVVVMALESAFLSPTVTDGYQTQFQRLRVRVNVAAPGIYTVEHPWGRKSYTVTTVSTKGGGGAREINDTVDVSFAPSSAVPGMVTPFLRWDPAQAPAAPAGYLGDGVTLHRVLGSPCGNNFVRISATALDGVTPLAIDPANTDGDGSTASYTSALFTVMGKLAPTSVTPLAVGNAYYSRSAAGTSITVMAQSSPAATVTATPGGVMSTDGNGRFYVSTAYTGATLPATVQVLASDSSKPTLPNDQPNVALRDLVVISRADATCSLATRLCTLVVDAQSSDSIVPPTLTLAHTATALVNGSVTVTNAAALPGSVTVISSAGGSASKPVTVVNQ
ncbi:MAG: hypothetical protein RLZZ584_1628 [Pseudomonadota bacterium]